MQQDVSTSHYVLLSTFRRDGTAVGSPVWAVEDSGRLLVWTEAASLKVRRIQRNPAVTVQACSYRGRTYGAATAGRAELLDEAGTARARRLLARKYGVFGRLAVRWPWPSYFRPSKKMVADIVKREFPATVAIAITLDSRTGYSGSTST